jgi:predicted nucleic acid-binding protein
MSYLPDTSCLVALLCSWHEHHETTIKEMNQRERSGDEAILGAHSLVETYSVLTRLPYPYRLSEHDAFELLAQNFSKLMSFHSLPFNTGACLNNAATATFRAARLMMR